MTDHRFGKVVHFSIVHPATDVRILRKECATLRAAGYDVTLYARGTAGVLDGVRVVPVAEHLNRAARMVIGPLRLVWSLLRERADIYHFHDPELIPVGLALRALRKRVIYDAHEWVPGDIMSKPYLRPGAARVLSRVAGALERLAARRLSHVVAATPFIAEQLPGDRVTVIRNYPDPAELATYPTGATTPPPGSGVVVYVGGINDERCGAEMIAAMRLVADMRPCVRLVAGGTFEDGLTTEGLPNVEHRGHLNRGAVSDLLSSGLVGLVLLRDLPNCRDAMPTKFFEYLGAGLAVIVSRSTHPIAEMTRRLECGIVVDEADPAAIASAIVELCDDPSRARAMGERGRSAVLADLNWVPEGERLVGLYNSLSAEGGRQGAHARRSVGRA
jgi:glycosyltransferase involved in cell wall biosynthesis